MVRVTILLALVKYLLPPPHGRARRSARSIPGGGGLDDSGVDTATQNLRVLADRRHHGEVLVGAI